MNKKEKVGDIRKPSNYCVKWEHDKSRCYDEWGEKTIGGKKYLVWSGHCQELERVVNGALRVVNMVMKGRNE